MSRPVDRPADLDFVHPERREKIEGTSDGETETIEHVASPSMIR